MIQEPEEARACQVRMHTILTEVKRPRSNSGKNLSPLVGLRKEAPAAGGSGSNLLRPALTNSGASLLMDLPTLQLQTNKYHIDFGAESGEFDTYRQLRDELVLENKGRDPVRCPAPRPHSPSESDVATEKPITCVPCASLTDPPLT